MSDMENFVADTMAAEKDTYTQGSSSSEVVVLRFCARAHGRHAKEYFLRARRERFG